MSHNTVTVWVQSHSSANTNSCHHQKTKIAIFDSYTRIIITHQNNLTPKQEYLCQNKVREERLNIERMEGRDRRGQPCNLRNESNSVTLSESCHISGHQVPLLRHKLVRLEDPSSFPSQPQYSARHTERQENEKKQGDRTNKLQTDH